MIYMIGCKYHGTIQYQCESDVHEQCHLIKQILYPSNEISYHINNTFSSIHIQLQSYLKKKTLNMKFII